MISPDVHLRPQVVALNGSYRAGGAIDTTLREILAAARAAGAETSRIDLVDHHVEFCRNCRQCAQEPGLVRGKCIQNDDVDAILTQLENADAIVLGSPVNFGDVTAMTRALLERMLGFAHWPWGSHIPKERRSRTRPAALVTSSSAPGFLTRFGARSLKTLDTMAKLLGARTVGRLVVGMVNEPAFHLDNRARRAARRLGEKLVGEVSVGRPRSLRSLAGTPGGPIRRPATR